MQKTATKNWATGKYGNGKNSNGKKATGQTGGAENWATEIRGWPLKTRRLLVMLPLFSITR